MRPIRRHAVAFGETSNPADYVPREATDLALAQLEASVRQGRPAALIGQPGLGKTLLLRLLEERMESKLRCVFLPYAALDLSELCAWALGLLGESASDAPVQTLLWYARSRAGDGSALLLLIDDASALPIETARGLDAVLGKAGGGLRIVLAAADGAASSRVVAALHPDTVEVRLHDVMTLAETEQYVHARLGLARAPAAAKARFDRQTVDRIHGLSGGIPRRVHDLAVTLLEDVPAIVGASSGDDRWLGAPIDDPCAEPALDDLDDDLEPLGESAEPQESSTRDTLGFFRRLLTNGF